MHVDPEHRMIEEYHPAGFDYHARYRDVRLLRASEGGAYYVATDGADALLISDEGTLADLLDDEPDLLARAVCVRRFSSAAARDAYLGARRNGHHDAAR
jgi:hypothetical protein